MISPHTPPVYDTSTLVFIKMIRAVSASGLGRAAMKTIKQVLKLVLYENFPGLGAILQVIKGDYKYH